MTGLNLQALAAKLRNAHDRLDTVMNNLSAPEFPGSITLDGIATPAAPASGNVKIWGQQNGATLGVIGDAGTVWQTVLCSTNRQSFTANNGSANPITATYTVKANDFAVGSIYRLTCRGVGSYTSGTATDLRTMIAGTAQAAVRYASLPGTFLFWAQAELVINTTGASGSAYVGASWHVSTTTTAGANPDLLTGQTGGGSGTTITFDTTADTTIEFDCSGNGTFSVTGLWSILERLGT